VTDGPLGLGRVGKGEAVRQRTRSFAAAGGRLPKEAFRAATPPD
jgi:hypothetical protein